MIFSSPPQRVQLSISTPNTRFSRLAQLIATCRGHTESSLGHILEWHSGALYRLPAIWPENA
jgi:hypothetical protein